MTDPLPHHMLTDAHSDNPLELITFLIFCTEFLYILTLLILQPKKLEITLWTFLYFIYIYTFCKVNKFLMLSFVKNCCHGDHHSLKVFQSGSNRRENLKIFNFDLIMWGEFQRYQIQGRKYNLKRHLENQICKNIRFISNGANLRLHFPGPKFWMWSPENTGLPKNNNKL